MANNITNVWKLMGIDPTTGTGTYKNRMGLGNAITRDNGIPLDLSTLHATYNDAVVYAATSSIAYVDQPIAAEGVLYLITEESQGKVKISSYRDSITGKLISGEEKEYDVYLKRVGIVPTGDNASIVVSGEGLVKLFAFDGAQAGAVPVKEDGKLVWKTLEEIGAGDGNDNTTYEFEVCEHKTGIVVTPLFNGQPIMEGEGEEAKQVKYHLDLDVYTKKEVDDAIAEAVDGLVDGDALAGAISGVEAKIPTVPTNVGAFTNDAGYLVASDIEGKADKSTTYTKTEVDTAISTAVEGILGEDVKEAYNTLKEIQDILEGTDGEAIDGLIEVADANKQALEVLNGAATVEGSVAKQIADAVAPLATTAELQRVEGIADAAQTADEVNTAISTALADYTNTETLNGLLDGKVDDADLDNYYTKNEVYAKNEVYTKGEADKAIADKISEVNGGESAGEVLGQLNAYKKINDTEVWGAEKVTEWTDEEGKYNPTYTGDSRVDVIDRKLATVEENADVNVIEIVKVNGTALTVDAQKAVDITVPTSITGMEGYSALDARVTENTNGIAALLGQLGTTNTNVSNNTTEIGKINTDISVNIKPAIEALEGADEVIEETLAEHTAAIKTINETTIPALQGAVNTKAAQTDVDAINQKIGTVEEGKTVVDMINAVAGKIDFSPYAKKDEVAATYATIAALEGIYKAGSGVEGAEDYVAPTGLLAEEIARAKAAEKANADAIALLTNNPSKELDSVIELINHVTEHGKEVEGIVGRIDGHDGILAGIGGEGQPATVLAAIQAAAYVLPAATAETLGGIKSAKDVVDGETTTVAVNKVYVDATTNVGEVKAVSTDTLVQGSMTLVLNGGNASATN